MKLMLGLVVALPLAVHAAPETGRPAAATELHGTGPAGYRYVTLDLEGLAAFPCPALLSEGDQSPPWFPVIIGRLAEVMQRSERHVYGGAGHVPYMTHPDEYIKTVTDFISAVR